MITDQELHAAARNAVQIASLEARADPGDPARHRALVAIVGCACSHGLTLPELCAASGLDAAYVTRLLEEPV